MKLPDWFKSDYQWVWNGELLRTAMANASYAVVTLGFTSLDPSEGRWWAGPIAIFAYQTLDYIRGRLPARD